MIYERMLEEHRQLTKKIKQTEQLLKDCPDGKIFCAKNGKYYKWYLTDGKTQTYLPKKKRKLAEKLAAKKYLSCLLQDLTHEKKAIEFYLRHHNSKGSTAEQLLLRTPEYKELLLPYFKPLSQELDEWTNSPYDSNTKYPEQLTHKTLSGNYVRSKSEVLINMVLKTHKIPFRYEAALQLGDTAIYPDFTIRHPENGKFYYWEHFGLMDDKNYVQNMHLKLKLYTSNGIIPSVQLITTYETKETPLTVETIEKLVDHYFL